MGGVKDIYWVIKGYGRAVKPETRAYMRDIGVITDYSPDILFRPNLPRFGKSFKLAGKDIVLPSQEKIRDASMWMFKGSESHTRYVTGSAGLEKWEYWMKKLAKSKDDIGNVVFSGRTLDVFKKKINLVGRETWVKADIERLLHSGTPNNWNAAKAMWIKDIVEDSQFLYSALDSPIVSQVGGSVTKSAMVFQTWWMNYASLLGKWMTRSGDVPATAERMFTFMLTSAIGYQAMEKFWGQSIARASVLTGPFPMSIDVPPSFRPVSDAMKVLVSASGIALGDEDALETTKKRMIAAVNSDLMLLPGGLVAKDLVKGARDEGIKGFLKGVVRYRPPKND
jgi:hypothetical protein